MLFLMLSFSSSRGVNCFECLLRVIDALTLMITFFVFLELEVLGKMI